MHEFVSRLSFRRDHRWAPARMSAYLDGDLAPRQRARLERHLSECHDCRRVYGGLSRLVDALGRLERPQPGRDAVNISAAVRLRLDAP